MDSMSQSHLENLWLGGEKVGVDTASLYLNTRTSSLVQITCLTNELSGSGG